MRAAILAGESTRLAGLSLSGGRIERLWDARSDLGAVPLGVGGEANGCDEADSYRAAVDAIGDGALVALGGDSSEPRARALSRQLRSSSLIASGPISGSAGTGSWAGCSRNARVCGPPMPP